MTSTTQVIKALKISDINVEEVNIGTKKTNKTVPIMFRDKTLVLQTPFLEITGGLRKTAYPNIYQLDTLFRGDTNQKINQWFQFIENLETHVSSQVVNNGSKWFTQNNIIIKSLIRELDPEKNIFFIKWAIDLKTNIFIDENKNPFNPATLKDKDLIKLIVEVSDLWIQENQCGLAVLVQKILVKPHIEKIQSEYIFDDGTDSENAQEDKTSDDQENNIISLLATEQKTRQKPNTSTSKNTPITEIVTHGNGTDKIEHPKVIKNLKQKTKTDTKSREDVQRERTHKQNKLPNETIHVHENSKNKKQSSPKKIQ